MTESPENTLNRPAQANRPPLVLVHGWGMHSGLFHPWVEQLKAHWRVHAVDLPGHGGHRHLPLAEEIAVAAEQLHALTAHLPAATWVGWSLGGLLTLKLALQRPERVRRLVMLCASPCFVRSPDWPEGVDESLIEQFGQDLRRDVHQTLHRFMALEVLGCANEKALLKQLRTLASHSPEPEAPALAAGLQLLKNTDLSRQLPRLVQPSLWIAGRRDRLVSPAAMEKAAARSGTATHPGAAGQYALIRGAGHAPFLTHADELTGLLRKL